MFKAERAIAMLVFLSWSGERSQAAAAVLCDWLPKVIQAIDPWKSGDIDKGSRWSPEIADKLEASRVGIICVTPENRNAPWLLFEAGALSKTKDANACTFLLGVTPADIEQPLGQFQHTVLIKEDVRKLIGTMNDRLADAGERPLPEKRLDEVFETYWPELAERLGSIISAPVSTDTPSRKDRELLEEILEILRGQESRRERLGLAEALRGWDDPRLSGAKAGLLTDSLFWKRNQQAGLRAGLLDSPGLINTPAAELQSPTIGVDPIK